MTSNNLGEIDTSLPVISIIIPAYNEEDTIAGCLDSLLEQTYPNRLMDVIVVDNNSTDNTQSIVADYPVKLVAEDKQGSYAARNAGVNNTEGHILAFTDADVRPHKKWLETGEIHLRHCDIVTGPIVSERAGERETLATTFDDVMGFNSENCKTANLLVRAKVFDKVGSFDERLTSGGDILWGQNARDNGFEVNYLDDLVVFHESRDSIRELLGKSIRTGYGAGQKTRLSQEPVGVWGIFTTVLLEPINGVVWYGWIWKRLVLKVLDGKITSITALLMGGVAIPLAFGTWYGRTRGFIEGAGGQTVGDYGQWY
jgi:glycosyltransferase involved in cell wall biosynthesis